MSRDLQRLYTSLGYEFTDVSLLESALTHRSVKAQNNERLEFLGDSIINFLIAEVLYKKCPSAREGKLSRIRASLVNGDTLAQIAMEFNIGDFLHLGPGEMKSGGHKRSSILADALEAIIAAIYLDAGMTACRKCILNWFESRLVDAVGGKVRKDPKTRLQEFLQAQKSELPIYTILAIDGDAHNQRFIIECVVKGYEHKSQGTGTSRRRAEQAAAAEYLTLLDIQS